MDLHRALDLYNKASEKEQKVIQMQKKLQNKKEKESAFQVEKLVSILKEKDKQIMLQAVKIRELIGVDPMQKQKIISRDYNLLQQLQNPFNVDYNLDDFQTRDKLQYTKIKKGLSK